MTLQLSPLIMGTWQAGGQYWPGADDGAILQAMDAAIEAGITAFDTAEEYGDGRSEALLGRALQGRREQVQILSKVFSNHLRAAHVREACERSLRNLQTDYLDLYQIHWPAGSWGSESVPLCETMTALMQLKHEGKIRAIGVSNFSLQQLKEAAQAGEIDSIQPPYSLFWRHIDREIRPWCEARGVSILAYSALAQGLLSGRFHSITQLAEDDNRRDNKLFHEPHLSRALAALAGLRDIAQQKGVSTAQIALAWCISRPLTHAIVGAKTAVQIQDSARAMQLNLSEAELAKIDTLGRLVSDPLLDDPVMWTWQP